MAMDGPVGNEAKVRAYSQQGHGNTTSRSKAVCGRPGECKKFLVGMNMWSGAVVCSASVRGSNTPRARMEMRGSGPTRIRALKGARPMPGSPDPVSLTVCPYFTSDLLT